MNNSGDKKSTMAHDNLKNQIQKRARMASANFSGLSQKY